MSARLPCPVCNKMFVNVAEHHTKMHTETVLDFTSKTLDIMGHKLQCCGSNGSTDPNIYIPVFEGWKWIDGGYLHEFSVHYNKATKKVVEIREQLTNGTVKTHMIKNVKIVGGY